MNTQIVSASYNDAITIDFTSDAWFNATAVASYFDKRPVDWLKLDGTKDYINKLCEIFNCEESSLLKTRAGKTGGGSWFHPKLAVAFARWLDIKFSIWCDMQIEKILHPPKIAPIPYITEPESQQFKKSIEHHCKNNSAKYGELYRKVYDHFGITSYKHIPHGKLEEAASICGLKLLKLSKPKPLGIEPPTQTGEYITRQEAEALCKQIMSRLPKEMPRQGIRHADKIAVPVNLSIYDIEYILNNHGYNLTKQH
jgi:hypothetical protein